MQSFLKNDELVIFTNAYFVFKFIETMKITGKYQRNIFHLNPVSSCEFNFFSTNQIEKLSKRIFLEDNCMNNLQFRGCLKNMYTLNKDFKPAFFHYNLQIHSTSIFINYKKGFIIFFNSNKTAYYNEVLKDICIYLNLIKSQFLKAMDRAEWCFQVYLVNSGKQIDDSFCFIYTNIFMKALLNSKKEVIDDASLVIEICNSITKKSACEFIYEEIYLKNKKMLDKGFFNRENDPIYTEFMKIRSEFDDLAGVSCKTGGCNSPKSVLLKKKSPYKVFKANISMNQYNQLLDVCFEKVSHTYAIKNFDLIQIQEGFKCSNGGCSDGVDNSFQDEVHRCKRIINFFDYEKRFVENFDRDFSFEYNLKEFATKSKISEKQSLYYKVEDFGKGEEELIKVELKKKGQHFNRLIFESKSKDFIITEKVIKNVCTYISFLIENFTFPFFIEKIKVDYKDGEFSVEKMGLKFHVSKFNTV